MIQALLSGVSSIQAQQTRMNVIGNDLANINTTAFKGQDVNFQDLISQSLQGATAPTSNVGGTNGIQYGLGVQVGSTTTNMGQGSLSATSNPADMAIQGNGFFMVSDGTNVSYTRDGTFQIDSSGNLVNASGERVLGWSADSTGTVDTTQKLTGANNIQIPIGALNAAQATKNVTLAGVLNSAGAATDTSTVTTTVYDSQGTAHDVTIQFSAPSSTIPTGAPAGAVGSWQWTAYSGDSATGTAIGSSATTGAPLYFDSNGSVLGQQGATNTITIPGSGAVNANLSFGGIQELAQQSQVAVTSQDGYAPGSLSGFSVGLDGIVTGDFSNGLEKTLGQIAVATFSNPSALSQTGSNLYQPSANSGVADVGTANSGNRGAINSGYLEQSNVDLSSTLTNLIITQRGFEANTKIVTTVDQLMQTLIDMKH